MRKTLVVVCAALSVAASQPQCSLDKHCADGWYCVRNLYECHPCTDCGVYGREPLPDDGCARAVAQCGECLPGHSVDASAVHCVPDGAPAPAPAPSPSPPPPPASPAHIYLWVCLLVALIVVLLALGLVLLFRLNWTTKIASVFGVTSIGERVHGARGRDAERPLHLPPPYNPDYRPSSPPAEMHKSYPDGSPRLGEARHQNATMYDTPHCVRPPTCEDVLNDSREGPELSDNENTVESVWTPSDNTSNGVESAGGLSEALREARARDTGAAPPKLPRVEIEEVDTRASSPDAASSSRALARPSPPRAPPPRPSPPRTPADGARINNITINFQVNSNL